MYKCIHIFESVYIVNTDACMNVCMFVFKFLCNAK